jgi:hypothetical protein
LKQIFVDLKALLRRNQISTKEQAVQPFELAQQILQTGEDVLVFAKTIPKEGIWRKLWWISDPFQSILLIFRGLDRMIRSIVLTVFYFILMVLLIYGVLRPLGIVNPENTAIHFYNWAGIIAIAIIFSKPSRYALTGYSAKEIERVLEQIPKNGGYSKNIIQATKSHLLRAEGDTKARLTTIKWVAGIPYAISIYMAQKGLDVTDGKIISDAAVPLLIALIIGAFVSLHGRATEVIYGLALSVLDQLESQEEKQSNSHSEHKQRMRQRMTRSK